MKNTRESGGATRIEQDTLGPVAVPAEDLWGAQTQRAIENFPIGRTRFRRGRPVVRALGILKKSAALSAHDAMVNASAAMRTLAGALLKIANDVRLYACGPRAGFAELVIPENEPGSSIMPGKVNPTPCEALTTVAAEVFGNDHAVAFAGSQGNFQLNVYKPIILYKVLESAKLLAEACLSFDEHCARGIEPNKRRIREHLENSLMLVTALTPHIGYEKAAEFALKTHREGSSPRDAALTLGHVSADQFALWVRPEAMAHPRDEGRRDGC